MTPEFALRLAYGFNVLVLAPVLLGLYAHRGSGVIAALGGGIQNVDGLRLLVGSLWAAVLLTSLAGLFQPRMFVPVLAFQVIYKSIYLATYVAPVVTERGWDEAPWGLAVIFAIIIALYPFAIWKAWA